MQILYRCGFRFLVLLLVFVSGLLYPALFSQAAPVADAAVPTSRQIIIITAQPYTSEWFASFNDAFIAEVSKAQPFVKINYEYIAGEIAGDPDLSAAVVSFLQQKYVWEDIGLIIGVMPAGSDFLLAHGNEFAAGIPQLFVLPTQEQLPQVLQRIPGANIQSGGNAIAGTLQNMQQLLPQTKHLYVVAGAGADDLAYLSQTQQLLATEKGFADVTYLIGLDANELLNKLLEAPADSVMLILTYTMNNKGQPVTTQQILRMIASQVPMPIFGFYDAILGNGITGGNLTSSEAYGLSAAGAANRLLVGKEKGFGIVVPNRFMYDWRELQRWKISTEHLPEGSEIKYVEYSLWERYQWYIVLVVFLVILQAITIIRLMITKAHLSKLEKSLRSTNIDLGVKVVRQSGALALSNEELLVANAELKAVNEEITAVNGALDGVNHQMEKEIEERKRIEAELDKTNQTLKLAQDHLENRNIYLESEVAKRVKEVTSLQDVAITAMALLAETHNRETGAHIQRTSQYVKELAFQLQSKKMFPEVLTTRNIFLLVKSAPLHDVGKMGISETVLWKPDKLTAAEYALVKRHTIIGKEAIEGAEKLLGTTDSFLRFAKEMASAHHERWDGTGYPLGLAGNSIPVSARLMALADVYDALVSRRIYKEPIPHEQACQMIITEAGKQFDPAVVEAFCEVADHFKAIAASYRDDEK